MFQCNDSVVFVSSTALHAVLGQRPSFSALPICRHQCIEYIVLIRRPRWSLLALLILVCAEFLPPEFKDLN